MSDQADGLGASQRPMGGTTYLAAMLGLLAIQSCAGALLGSVLREQTLAEGDAA